MQTVFHHVLPLAHAGHPDRHDHRHGAGARRDRAAADDRHGRLHRRRPGRRRWSRRRRCRCRSILWADSPERAFVERTSAAIIVLLGFLIVMNASRSSCCADASSGAGNGDRRMNDATMLKITDDRRRAVHATNRAIKIVGARRQRLLRREAGAVRRQPRHPRPTQVTALIGPSGCGKSTFLRCLNRMNDTIADLPRRPARSRSTAQDIYDPTLDVVQLRARVGMVFQKPNPFPKSIYENVAYGPRIHGLAAVEGRARRDRRRQPANAPACGTRSRTGSTSRAPACPAASSSACASPAPSPSSPR